MLTMSMVTAAVTTIPTNTVTAGLVDMRDTPMG
jgi:hypothetical protein